MFNLLIVKLFENCIFVLRTELMVWENGPTKISYIMLTIEKTDLPNSAISFCDQHLLIDFMLLFRTIRQNGLTLYP